VNLRFQIITHEGEVLAATDYADMADIIGWGICYRREITVDILRDGEVWKRYRQTIKRQPWVESVYPGDMLEDVPTKAPLAGCEECGGITAHKIGCSRMDRV
jgi:hypothetical protein